MTLKQARQISYIKDFLKQYPIGKTVIKWAIILSLAGLVWFANRQAQRYLGEQARIETGLSSTLLAQAFVLAQRDHKLVLAEMSAVWCPTCRKLDQTIFSNEKVKAKIKADYIFSRIDYDSAQAKTFMENYQVRGFPTVLVLNAHGEQLARLPLTFNSQEFIAMLAKVSGTVH